MTNSCKYIIRDWRGLAYLLKFSVDDVLLLSNPTIHMLTLLKQKQKIITIKDFQTMMEQISRWDIIDDTEDMFGIYQYKFLCMIFIIHRKIIIELLYNKCKL